MADQQQLLDEAYKRNLLPPDRKAAYEEAQKRGLIGGAKVDTPFVQTGEMAGPPTLAQLSEKISKAETAVGNRYMSWQGKLPGVDYSGDNIPFWLRTDMNRSDNPAEAKKRLIDKFGVENVIADPGGRLIVLPNGFDRAGLPRPKKPTVMYGYQPGTSLGRVGAGLAAMAPEMAGMAAAQAIPVGGEVADAGWLLKGAIKLGQAAIGSAAGKAANDAAKSFQGFYDQTADQFIHSMMAEAGGGLVSEATFGLIKAPFKIGYKLLNPAKKIPENIKADAAAALEMGLTPSVSQATAGKAKLWGIAESMVRQIFPTPADKVNFYIMNQQMAGLLKKAGVPDDQIGPVMDAVLRGDIPMAQLNDDIRKSVQSYVTHLGSLRDADIAKANGIIDQHIASLNQALPQLSGNREAGQIAKNAISTVKDTFDTEADKLYGQVDAVVGNVPLVPSGSITDTAKRLLKAIPPTTEGQPAVGTELAAQLKRIADMKDFITFDQAQFARRTFREAAYSSTVVANVPKHMLGELKRSVDQAFADAANSTVRGAAGADALRAADKFYAENIGKFDDVLVNQIALDARAGGTIPENVVLSIMSDGAGSQVDRIHNLLSATPEVWSHVQGAYWDSLKFRARDVMNETKLSGERLRQTLLEAGNTLDATFGKARADEMRELSRKMAAVDGKVDINLIKDANFKQIVESMVSHQADIDKFMDTHFLAALGKPGALADSAMSYVLKPGHTDRLRQAIQFFEGHDPSVVAQIRQKAMQDVLGTVVKSPSNAFMDIFDGARLEAALRKYSRETLTALYGPEMVSDLEKFARSARLVTQKGGEAGFGTSLAAAALALHPLAHLHGLAARWVESQLMVNQQFIHWLSQGVSGDNLALKALNLFAKNVGRVAGAYVGEMSGRTDQPAMVLPDAP